ncbi:MAG: acyl-CoA thioesterase [Gemmatimonadales bacterium]|nr:MAG: acyl-CoA thioesterase [Gemmatimonadales bacterium]
MIPRPSHFRVRSYELDGLGHLNHAVFLNYFEQARFDTLEQVGISPCELETKGWGVHVVRVEVDFRRECRQGDSLRVRTWVESMRNSSMVLRQIMERESSGEGVAEALVVAVWVRLGGGPMRIPEEVRSSLNSIRESGGPRPSERRP